MIMDQPGRQTRDAKARERRVEQRLAMPQDDPAMWRQSPRPSGTIPQGPWGDDAVSPVDGEGVVRQIVDVGRRAVPAQIRGRGAYSRALDEQPSRDQAGLVAEFAHADRQVQAFLDEI